MIGSETGRSAQIRRSLERRYAESLSHMLVVNSPEPHSDSEDHPEWVGSKKYLERLRTEDPRTLDIITRLIRPIEERLIEMKAKILEERKKYSKGYRRRMAALYAEMIEGEDLDYRWRVVEADFKPRPGAGGWKTDGTYVPPDAGYVEPPEEEIEGIDQQMVSEYDGEKQKYLAPLTPEEKRRIDHELG